MASSNDMSNSSINSTTLGLGPENIIGAIFVGLLMLATLFGNFLVWASFITFRELRTKCNYFIISLAVADIMVALLAMPFWFILQLEPDLKNYKILDATLMQFWNCIDILCGTASIMNLLAVSGDRHLAITAPYKYHEFLTSFRAIMIICFVWVYAVTISLLNLAKNKIPNSGYHYLVSTASLILPLLAMIIMYARIYMVARRQSRMINLHQSYKTDIKAAKTIAVVIGAFVVCWLPFFVMIIGYAVDQNFISDPHFKVLRAIKWMEYLNSCLNPIIYCCLNRTYRGAFKRLFKKWRKSLLRMFFSKYQEANEDDNFNTTITRTQKTPILGKSREDLNTNLNHVNENGNAKTELLASNGNGVHKQTQV